jgi:hypothetical protein
VGCEVADDKNEALCLQAVFLQYGGIGANARHMIGPLGHNCHVLRVRVQVADNFVAREFGDGDDRYCPADQPTLKEFIPDAQFPGIGFRRAEYAGVVDDHDLAAGEERCCVAEIDKKAVAGEGGQLDLLPGLAAQSANMPTQWKFGLCVWRQQHDGFVAAMRRQGARYFRCKALDSGKFLRGEAPVDVDRRPHV